MTHGEIVAKLEAMGYVSHMESGPTHTIRHRLDRDLYLFLNDEDEDDVPLFSITIEDEDYPPVDEDFRNLDAFLARAAQLAEEAKTKPNAKRVECEACYEPWAVEIHGRLVCEKCAESWDDAQTWNENV